MADNFDKFISSHKKYYSENLTASDISFIEKKFNKDYSEFIKQEGISGYDKGLFWVVNPTDYEDTVKEFKLNPAILKVVVRTAFADLIITDGVGVYFFYTSHNERYQFSSSLVNLFNLFLCTKKFLRKELKGEVFDKVGKRLGPLNEDECYGYVPALPLGGAENIENLQKVKIKEYLSILAQAQV